MIVLAMSAAVLVGGGTMLMTEAAVSAIIIGSSASSSLGVLPVRPLEALVGGGVAFAVHSLLFPPDPLLHVGRAANEVFAALGRTLRDVSAALRTGDPALAERALAAARSIDVEVGALNDALALGRETARLAPRRRSARGVLERQEEIARHLDFAVRNARVLARDTVRYAHSGGPPVPDLADAVDDLGEALWALAAAFDQSGPAEEPRLLALRAAARASEAMARHDNLTLIEIAGQIRSTAADLMRAAQAGAPDDSGLPEASTEEMLTAPPPGG
jgi:uncharacterized membrane protein YgaE (UPF0421/DUF939 family)